MKNYLFLLLIFAANLNVLLAQIPNEGFENWATRPLTYNQDPVGWITSNSLTAIPEGSISGSLAPVRIDSNSHSGKFAISITSSSTGYFQTFFPGFAFTQTGLNPGFPFTLRPAAFSGYYRYTFFSSKDTASVYMGLYKWNTAKSQRDTIGTAILFFTDSIGTDYATGMYLYNLSDETGVVLCRKKFSIVK